MSFVNKNIGKPSLVKPIAVVVAVLLLVGGIYSFFGSKKGEKVVEEAKKEITNEAEAMVAGPKPSGLEADERVKNVEDVEKVVAKWIEANPHMVMQSIMNMQKKMQEDRVKNAQKSIGEKKEELFNDKSSPVFAPEGYDVVIVEFFDYSCGYCKKSQSTVDQLLQADKKIKIVYKEFPILGPSSMEMSQVSTAVALTYPESYKKFHDALMKTNERGKAAALKAASSVGLSSAKLEEVLKSQKDKIDSIIQSNLALGSSIGINGTPGFVIGEELIPGAVELGEFKSRVAAVRTAK